ncbi:MAG: UDP-N-acetylmuramoyl-L-alanyl-D-glutamate--2,6-diaminopimelate ligase, partial [Rhodobacteraceae bacterium]|nr:UDP-N-acetylmuramoyl-L-alanyl-D-glutamate--2,6-diaminopimelate ligase [Paracoccaceae bacterium]
MAPQHATSLTDLGLTVAGGQGIMITGLAIDSRAVKPGFLFAALSGSQVHGGEFIQYALRMGAAAVLTDAQGAKIAAKELAASDAVLVLSEDPRAAIARAAALWYGPTPETMVAVTGTNGKTSVACFARQLWQVLGRPAVNLGTTGVEGDFQLPLRHTTPDPLTLHQALAAAAKAGISHVAMEASSHGLDQRRLDGVVLAAAGFTNLSQDHLDYHHTMEEYLAAKAGLFSRILPEEGVAVINIDDAAGPGLAGAAAKRGQEVITIGHGPEARLRLLAQRFDATGQDLRFDWQGRAHMTRLDLIGGFQASNAAMAACLLIAAG